ncbi:MAG: hypothetical protein ABL952_15640 [Pyrinomonadaceae bacterium]
MSQILTFTGSASATFAFQTDSFLEGAARRDLTALGWGVESVDVRSISSLTNQVNLTIKIRGLCPPNLSYSEMASRMALGLEPSHDAAFANVYLRFDRADRECPPLGGSVGGVFSPGGLSTQTPNALPSSTIPPDYIYPGGDLGTVTVSASDDGSGVGILDDLVNKIKGGDPVMLMMIALVGVLIIRR